MSRTSLSILLSGFMAASVAACGAGSQSAIPAGSTFSNGAAATTGMTRAGTMAVAAVAAPLLSGTVSDLASYGFDACPPAGTVYIAGYGCIPITTTSAKITGTQAVGMYFQVYGSASGPNVTATSVNFSTTPPTPAPVAAPTGTALLVGKVSDLASYGFDACPPAGTTYIAGYGCIPVTTTKATITGTQAVGMYAQVYGSVSGANVTATSVTFTTTAPVVASPAPVATATGAPLLSGTVSDLATYGFDACPPAGTTYITGYGCIPITTTKAKIVGTQVVGAAFRAFGSASGANVTATEVDFTAAAAATPAPATTAAPAGGGMTNGVEWPATFAPFVANGPWSNIISANPTLLSNSAAIIANEFASGNNKAVRSTEVGQYDYDDDVIFASATDPVVNVSCSTFCDHTDHGGLPATIHIPAQARVPGAWNGGSGDRQMEIVQPGPTYSAVDVAYVNQPSGNWGTAGNTTLVAGGGAACGSFYGANGENGMYGTSTGDTADGNCISAGMIRPSELIAGKISHALKIILECQGPGTQYPVAPGLLTDACPSANGGPPLGARLWYDVPDATTNAGSQPAWSKAILNALHDYGGYFGDNSCPNGDGSGHCTVNVSGIGFKYESDEAAFDFGKTNMWSQIPGWTSVNVAGAGPGDNNRWVGADPWNPSIDWSHMHWLAACSAQGAC